MRFQKFSFGSIRIDGTTYEHDVVIDRGEVRKAKRDHPKNSVKPLATRRFLQRGRAVPNILHGHTGFDLKLPSIGRCFRRRRAAAGFAQK